MNYLYNDLLTIPSVLKILTSKGLLFAYYKCPPIALRYTINTDQDYFVYILRGKKVFHTADNSYTLLPGNIVFVRKGFYVMEWFADEFEIMIISVPEEFIRQIIEEVRIHYHLKNQPIQASELVIGLQSTQAMLACLDSLLPYFLQTPPPSNYILEIKFREFILNVLLNPWNNNILQYLNQSLQEYKPSIQNIMEDNFMHNLSLNAFAKLSCRSLAAFKREFKELFKEAPGYWLMQKRLDYAKLLLGTTHMNVNDVALESGFENSSHFSRVYKDKFGISPNLYRKSVLITIHC